MAAAAGAAVPHQHHDQQQAHSVVTTHGSQKRHSKRQRQHPQQHPAPACAARLAAEHPAEAAHMRQLAAAELARLQAEAQQQQQQQQQQQAQQQQQQQQPRKRRWLRAKQQAAAAELGSAGAAVDASAAAEAAAAAAGDAASTLPAELPPRFTDAELMRFALMQGLRRARTPQQRAAALREGAAAAARTALWLQQHPFSTPTELQRYAHLARWDVRGGRAVWWRQLPCPCRLLLLSCGTQADEPDAECPSSRLLEPCRRAWTRRGTPSCASPSAARCPSAAAARPWPLPTPSSL